MGTMAATKLVGQFMHPLIQQDTENDDPWQRNYYQPPQLKKLVPRTYPLVTFDHLFRIQNMYLPSYSRAMGLELSSIALHY